MNNFHSIYDCRRFFKNPKDKRKDNVELKVVPKASEEYLSVSYGYTRFIDSYRILSSCLDGLTKTLQNNDSKILKKISLMFGIFYIKN